jgi:hypothetical protein
MGVDLGGVGVDRSNYPRGFLGPEYVLFPVGQRFVQRPMNRIREQAPERFIFKILGMTE